jgi:hypothetical protein
LGQTSFGQMTQTRIMVKVNLVLFNSFVKYLRFDDNEINLETFEILDEVLMVHFVPKMRTLLKFKKDLTLLKNLDPQQKN